MSNRPHPVEAIDLDDSVDARIRRAEVAIAGLKANFASWVKGDLVSIDVHLTAAKAAGNPDVRNAELEALRRVAHNIKGQGGTFGCHGLSAAAAELDGLLKRRGDAAVLAETDVLVGKLNAAYAQELA